MAVEALLGHLEGRKASEALIRGIPVHYDGVLLIQMDVQLVRYPGAVFGGTLRVLLRVSYELHGLCRHIRVEDVRCVSVFTVEVVGDYNMRLEPPYGVHDELLEIIPGVAVVSEA